MLCCAYRFRMVWSTGYSRQHELRREGERGGVPDGSLRWERVARSSAVSSNGGLRSGGRSSLPSLISLTVVLMTVSYTLR